MLKLVYIASSSFSGSTLLSFILNNHPQIFTVGHTVGWRFKKDETFQCSCGNTLERCPFFTQVAKRFHDTGRPFEFNDFGTDYRLVTSERLNHYLTARLPIISPTALERFRDRLVRLNPLWSQKIHKADDANEQFIRFALEYSGAKVYLDNGHSPYRLRDLARSNLFKIYIIYLIRDFRGVILSYMRNNGLSIDQATEQWLREQSDIIRISEKFENKISVYYEDVCDDSENALRNILSFTGVDPGSITGKLDEAEHHILGNVMRLRDLKITKDTKWRRELSEDDLTRIYDTARRLVAKTDNQALRSLISRYEPIF